VSSHAPLRRSSPRVTGLSAVVERDGGKRGEREGRERSVFFHAGRRNDLGAQEGKSAVGTKNKGGFEKKEISSALPVC